MPIQRAARKRKSKVQSEIPDSSLADIAFLLLIFFMVTTEFRQDRPREVQMPEAGATQPLDDRRSDVLHLWIEEDGALFLNDAEVEMDQVASVVRPLYEESGGALVVAIRSDRGVSYAVVDEVMAQLREAGALRVNFATSQERPLAEQR